MKLYLSAGACSLSPHIALREAGLPFTVETVDLKSKKTGDGQDFLAINPKGYVPVLELDDGNLLTEGPAIVQYLADLAPDAHLAPPYRTLQRYRLFEWLNFISTELHKSFGAIFHGDEAAKKVARAAIEKRLDTFAERLRTAPYLLGQTFGVADAYLFTMLTWTPKANIDLSRWPPLQAFYQRVADRPAVRAALQAEKALSPEPQANAPAPPPSGPRAVERISMHG